MTQCSVHTKQEAPNGTRPYLFKKQKLEIKKLDHGHQKKKKKKPVYYGTQKPSEVRSLFFKNAQ